MERMVRLKRVVAIQCRAELAETVVKNLLPSPSQYDLIKLR